MLSSYLAMVGLRYPYRAQGAVEWAPGLVLSCDPAQLPPIASVLGAQPGPGLGFPVGWGPAVQEGSH